MIAVPSDMSARIRFLNDSAHLLAASAPETSRYLMLKRNALASDNNIDPVETNMSKTCNACGTLMIIGWQGTVYIESRGTGKKMKDSRQRAKKRQRSRTLVYECNTCHRKSRDDLNSSLKSRQKLKSSRSKPIPSMKKPSNHEQEKNSHVALTPPSGIRKVNRKRKNNTLEALIAKKKSSQTSSVDFDLMDFLKKA
ncbi:putative rnase p rpr2 rpp21 snm1 subunit domain-containing protein [Golovinomyces cichoracearum]|uniref:Putative rnase p rpr2 rpp21 snm1 subunit domain-containing protein n=1 Tax=Golovinomyces cichoracearum TaxID=62708 RepID=A0A420HAK2_9PEZI|nr:putative rnase p rpr2 rpp21 snm1 subunit domain-containing protein [Golovinomyces cichoracearum]